MGPTREPKYGSEHFYIVASSYYWSYRNNANSRLARLIQYILHVRSHGYISRLKPASNVMAFYRGFTGNPEEGQVWDIHLALGSLN
jgi:hypothetical protein